MLRTKNRDAADAAEEDDYMTYLKQAMYELRTGSAEIAIEYLDEAVKNDPDDELPFVIRSKCLNK